MFGCSVLRVRQPLSIAPAARKRDNLYRYTSSSRVAHRQRVK